MSRIATAFERLKPRRRCALVAYLMAGDPERDSTVPLMHTMVAAGADILELGVPFSDPMADGPVIQAAGERALRNRVTLRDTLDMLQSFRERDPHTPVVLMGYLNPIETMGCHTFAQSAAQAGVDGVITVDLPPEEADELVQALAQVDIDPIFLLAPTTTPARIETICAAARGFIYYVSLKGVTGAATLDVAAVARKLDEIRARATTPIGVGFGIKDAASAGRMAQIADAVVVGSALVERIADNAADADAAQAEVAALLRGMRDAMDARASDVQVA
ncbi:MAG: tryptophan synthase subunit alpha [Gammaproteobacteria bacterium]|nr:tryptophan synthase subunit alpha [Gammaproteobacteria bacterium]